MPAKHASGPFYLKKPAADRLAELLGVPVSPRTLEGWDIPYVVVAGCVTPRRSLRPPRRHGSPPPRGAQGASSVILPPL